MERLSNEHTAQCLKTISEPLAERLCLLVNFQKPKVEWKRVVLGFQVPTLAG